MFFQTCLLQTRRSTCLLFFCCRDFTEYSAERNKSCRVAQMFAVPILGTPCKPCHPFAPVHPRATEAGQKLGQPMASCLVKRVTRSHPYTPGRPHWIRVYFQWTTAWVNIHSHAWKKQVHTSPSMASCPVNRVTRSHPHIPGRPGLARNLGYTWHHAL